MLAISRADRATSRGTGRYCRRWFGIAAHCVKRNRPTAFGEINLRQCILKASHMKRKPQLRLTPAVAPEIMEGAKRSVSVDRSKAPVKVRCLVCGGDTTSEASEQLCWVCRRLKISAWREVEQQTPVQE